ncbi:MAG: type IV pilus twitching motility protein PilT [Deferribacterota bacterium]|nr:type IV pilus twitching motility protein PilT [Deferribacterota bacterium]
MYIMKELLEKMIEFNATDLHITAGTPPVYRIAGNLVHLEGERLTPDDTKRLCYSVLTDFQKKKLEENWELDLSFGIEGVSRFRSNIFYQRGAVAGAFRRIPFEILELDTLGLPPVVKTFTDKPRGLILVTGPTGSGKSTTLAAMIDKINNEKKVHIVTVEDPIEYLYKHKNAIVNQREVNSDTRSFNVALKYILRQDPDVVLIGELRDLDTIQSALRVAETGHLTFGTLHTNDAISTINRVIDVFPPHQQQQVRVQLSFVIEGVISQQLLPRMDGQGLCLASEVLVVNHAVRNLIRDSKAHQIYSLMQSGQREHGMTTMSQSLFNLYVKKYISEEVAIERAVYPDEVRTMINKVKVGINRRW